MRFVRSVPVVDDLILVAGRQRGNRTDDHQDDGHREDQPQIGDVPRAAKPLECGGFLAEAELAKDREWR
jgi:hypothetical protein